jgi:hypothetical protein
MLDIDLSNLLTSLCHVNAYYAVGLAAIIYAVRAGVITLPNIPGVFIKDDPLAVRLKTRAAGKFTELVKAGKDPDEAHAAIVAAIKNVR